jgi:hypothetical protein
MRQDEQLMPSEGISQSESCGMAKRVAVLLVRNLSDALHGRRIEIADTELHWLIPGQYQEGDWGVRFFPSRASERLVGLLHIPELRGCPSFTLQVGKDFSLNSAQVPILPK